MPLLELHHAFSHVWSAKFYQGIWIESITDSSTQRTSPLHHQPQLCLGQRPSTGREISRNARWLCLSSLSVHTIWPACNDKQDGLEVSVDLHRCSSR